MVILVAMQQISYYKLVITWVFVTTHSMLASVVTCGPRPLITTRAAILCVALKPM